MSFIKLYLYLFQDSIHVESFQVPMMLVTAGVVLICLYYVSKYLEGVYARKYKKPYYVHFYVPIKKLPSHLSCHLKGYDFYNQLDKKRKKYFEHRVLRFLEETNFVGREGIVVDDKKRMEISMMVIQLTFGMRNYLLEYVETIILYPTSFYSVLNKTNNNGEFHPGSRALALSWEHFEKGNRCKGDRVNLGIHEITHAIHFDATKSNNISSEIFYDTFLLLEQYLGSQEVRDKIVETKLLREYAYTDKFEFIAVLVEVFMEAPEELRRCFPEIYSYVQQMLNFKYFKD